MDYSFNQDLKSIREILGLTQSELVSQIGVQQVTISRSELCQTDPSAKLLEDVYGFAFERNIRINRLKEMLWREDIKSNHKLLFHGAKKVIEGSLSVYHGRANNDFGQGFYTGESYEQAISYISGYDKSSVYLMDFDAMNLKCKRYRVDRDWMLTIAYYRGCLEGYENHSIIKELIQCKHCLAATNLGLQYVFISERAIKQVNLIERCYASANEKEYYMGRRNSDAKLGEDNVKLARIQYRGQGRYIDEIMGEENEKM